MSAKSNGRMLTARALGAVLVAVFAVLAAGCTVSMPVNPPQVHPHYDGPVPALPAP